MQPALDSLADVLDYTIEQFGSAIASRTENEIFSTVESIETFPFIGSVIPEISDDRYTYRRLQVSRQLSVIYRLKDDIIYIMFVWNSRRSLHNIYYFFNKH